MKQLPVLTGLRGVAAYAVLIAHAVDFGFGGHLHRYLVGLASFGMSLFFVLSGFVICYNYLTVLNEGYVVGSYRFFVARFARLYPLYILMLAISLTRFPYAAPYDGLFASPAAGLSALTLTQSWFNFHGISGILFGQSWSISTEWFFYAFFLFICIPVARIRRPVAGLIVFLLASVVAFITLFSHRDAATQILDYLIPDQPPLSAPPWLWFTYFSPYLRTFEFVAGVLACRAYLVLRNTPTNALAAGLILAACLALIVAVMMAASFVSDGIALDMLRTFAYAPMIAPAILVLCLAPSFISRFLDTRILGLMGEISYSVYALQFFLLAELSRSGYAAVTENATMNSVFFSILAITVTSALAIPTYWLFEKPARRLLRGVMMPAIMRAKIVSPVSGSRSQA